MLPRCFNSADKAAERVANGLVWAFAEACGQVISCPRESDSPRHETRRGIGAQYGELYTINIWPINRQQVKNTYQLVWLPRAEHAYVAAGNEIENSAGKFLSAQDDADEVVWILGQYLEHHSVSPSALFDERMSKLELQLSA